MCSTPVQRIAEIGQAIDDLAADARTAYRPAARKQRQPAVPGGSGPGEQANLPGAPTAAGATSGQPARRGGAEPALAEPSDTGAVRQADAASDADAVMIRLAALWGRLAELDPEVAKRLPTYDA